MFNIDTSKSKRFLRFSVVVALAFMLVFSGCKGKDADTSKVDSTPTTAAPTDKPADPDAELFSRAITLDEYPAWINKFLQTRKWKKHSYENRLTNKILTESYDLDAQFMIKNQKPEGNFNYEYDWVKKTWTPGDNQVRQAGALWGVGLGYAFKQDPKVKKALDKGLEFFFKHTQEGPIEGSLVVAYPGDPKSTSGTVALVAMAIVEYLRADKINSVLSDTDRKKLNEKLDGYLKFLVWMRLENKHFSRDYSLLTKTKSKSFSPYFDGETMLCLTKAAKYAGHTELVALIEDSAMVLAKDYTIDKWLDNRDSDKTKGFFQWSCMTFWEYYDAGWANKEVFGDYVLAMTWWMIHTHRTLKRTKGTGYAYEGIIHGYKIAQARKMEKAINDIGYTIDKAMFKLISWQVAGPLQKFNKFITANKDKIDELSIGGHMNHKRQAPQRIDVTQHTMHATLLAIKYVYPE